MSATAPATGGPSAGPSKPPDAVTPAKHPKRARDDVTIATIDTVPVKRHKRSKHEDIAGLTTSTPEDGTQRRREVRPTKEEARKRSLRRTAPPVVSSMDPARMPDPVVLTSGPLPIEGAMTNSTDWDAIFAHICGTASSTGRQLPMSSTHLAHAQSEQSAPTADAFVQRAWRLTEDEYNVIGDDHVLVTTPCRGCFIILFMMRTHRICSIPADSTSPSPKESKKNAQQSTPMSTATVHAKEKSWYDELFGDNKLDLETLDSLN
ncbi:hypothetical protein DAEQUDRAFT_513496 [Daedalea quercina L-15889]|uniref:Uncharacterized protein n=1 Tax=Daedalea quercina L-15889 TaxID=1314783 RepID=A0A165MHI8_9APHY|nr:hypothetical protein DAEQUDRAFT_513496 [Daedalea quercina L-15889]